MPLHRPAMLLPNFIDANRHCGLCWGSGFNHPSAAGKTLSPVTAMSFARACNQSWRIPRLNLTCPKFCKMSFWSLPPCSRLAQPSCLPHCAAETPELVLGLGAAPTDSGAPQLSDARRPAAATSGCRSCPSNHHSREPCMVPTAPPLAAQSMMLGFTQYLSLFLC